MSKEIVLLTGLPGAGKTYIRTNNPDLMMLPFVDIADVYQDLGSEDVDVVASHFIGRIDAALSKNDRVVVECYGTMRQINYIIRIARVHDAKFTHVPIGTSLDVCKQRVRKALAKNPGDRYHEARLRILESVDR